MTVRDSAVAVGASFQLALVQWASWKLAPTAEWQLLAYDHVIGLPYPQLTRFSMSAAAPETRGDSPPREKWRRRFRRPGCKLEGYLCRNRRRKCASAGFQ